MNSIKDLQTLTTIPERTINDFFKKFTFCICNEVQEALLEGSGEVIETDLVIGKLFIKNSPEGIKYKFVPGEYFKKNIEDTLKHGKNPLKCSLSKTLVKKFLELYKNLC